MEIGHFRAMGTDVEVRAHDTAGIQATTDVFAAVEELASRFREDSELSRLNRASARRVPVSDCLAQILDAAADLHERTDGLVDAGVGDAVIAWGYDRTFEEMPDVAPEPDSPISGSWGVDGREVWRDRGVKLDLGGIAKGWTCDFAVGTGLAEVVSAGGDVRSRDPDTLVEVMDPWGHVAARIPVGVGALATSSITRRAWKAGTTDAHHLIDPRSGCPSVTPVLSATAAADSAVEAEAGAKAVLLRGADGLAWAAEQSWLHGALAVWRSGSVYATPRLAVRT